MIANGDDEWKFECPRKRNSLSTFTNRLTHVTWKVRLRPCTGCVLAAARFRAEAFDAFNTPQFSNPDSSLEDGDFGQVTSTKSDNRLLQLALKYYF